MAKFSIPVKDASNNVIGNQVVKVGKNQNIEFFYEGLKISIDTKSNKIVLDNSKHEFDSISADEVISIPIKNIKIDSKGNIEFTMDSTDDARTFKVDANSLSVKSGKEFKPVKVFDKPFEVTLPKNLPELINSKKVEMTKPPVQMFDMFVENYGYTSFELPDKNLRLLKSPDGALFSVSGPHIQPCGEVAYYKSGSNCVLGIKDVTKPGALAGKSTSAIGYSLTPEELAEAGKFIKGEELTPKDYKKIKKNDMTVDFTQAKPLGSEVTKKMTEDDGDASDGNPNNAKETTTAPTSDTKPTESEDPVDPDKKDDNKKDDDKKDDDGDKKKAKPDPEQEKLKKEAEKKKRAAIIKGIQVVALVAFASAFMPVALGAAGATLALGPLLPIFGVIALGLISAELTSVIDKFVARIGGLFSLIKDIRESVDAHNKIKDLSKHQQKKLNALQEKLNKGKKLSKRQLKKYNMLSQRQKFNLSKNEWKEQMRNSISFQPFVNVQRLVHEQETKFINDKQKVLDQIDAKIKACEKLLKDKDSNLTDAEKAELGKYRDDLREYREKVDGIVNPDQEKNNEILDDLANDVKDNDWASRSASELANTTFSTAFEGSKIGETPKIDNPDLASKINDLVDGKTKDHSSELDK